MNTIAVKNKEPNRYKHGFYLFVFTIFYPLLSFSQINLSNDSIASKDSILHVIGKEVVVTQSTEKKLSGLSIGKTLLNPAGVSQLPSLLGNTDLLKLLELTPGVQNSGDANTNMYIRGGDPGQNLLLYNETPVYTPGHLVGFFSLFNADHIASLELSKSGMNVRYGGRLSSAVEVSTKKIIPENLSVTGSVGLLSSQTTLQLPLGKKFGLYLSGRKTYIEWLMQPLLNATVNYNAKNRVEGLAYRFQDVNFTFLAWLSGNDKIVLDVFAGNDHFNILDNDLLMKGNLEWKNILFSAKWEKQIAENLFTQQSYLSKYANSLATNQAKMKIDMLSNIRDIGYKNKYCFHFQDIPFETGLQYAFHTIQPQSYQIVNIEQTYGSESPEIIKAHEAACYLTSSFSLARQTDIEWGLRYNCFYHNKLFQSLEPRIVLRYRLKEQSIVRAGYSRQNQYLNLLTPSSAGIPMDFWSSASEKIHPQSGNEFFAGYFQSFNREVWELSAEIFYRTMYHLNEYSQSFITNPGQSYLNNLFEGSGRAYGLEVILKKNYGKWTGWLSYTLGRSERTFNAINHGKTFPARFDRRHDLSFVSTYSFAEKWDFSFVYVYATGNAYTLPSSWYFINNMPVKEYGDYNSARMPAYNRADISVNYWYKKDNGINFSIFNLFMVNNPVYIFLNVKQDKQTGNIVLDVKQKKLYTLIPSVSWRFKF